MIISKNNNIKHVTEKEIAEMYLDYFNNFLTVSRFADHYGISYFSAQSIIKKGKQLS